MPKNKYTKVINTTLPHNLKQVIRFGKMLKAKELIVDPLQ